VLTAVSRTADSTFIGCEGCYVYRNDQIRPIDKSFYIEQKKKKEKPAE